MPRSRIVHISDMHLFRYSASPWQFFTKQWIGNCNLLFNRQWRFHRHPDPTLLPLFQQLEVTDLVIAGDMTTTSLHSEFRAALQFINDAKEAGFTVHIIPGNHDNYTHSAFRTQRFYNYLAHPPEQRVGPFSLKTDHAEAHSLSEKWWWVGLDTTVAAGLLRSNGVYSPAIERHLLELLQSLPSEDHVLLANHFPLTTTNPSHDMEGLDQLRQFLTTQPQIKLYLHGHIHTPKLDDRRAESLPIFLNSGSCGMKQGSTFQLIDLDKDECVIQCFIRNRAYNPNDDPISNPPTRWSPQEKMTFHWNAL